MPKPKTKSELLELAQSNFDELLKFVKSIDAENLQFPKGHLNRNTRDVLAHLYHWHVLFQDWYRIGMQGEKPEMPAPGYTWRTTPALNQSIQEMYQTVELPKIQRRLKQSHRKLMKLIESHSQNELFEKKRYTWTGSTSLGAYLISATSSHYHWAIQLLKKL